MASVVFLFAPGAGLPSDSPWMTRWAGYLEPFGSVVRFDYPYRLAGKQRPDRLPVLIEHHQRMLDDVRSTYSDRSIVLVGKSMGSRVGCHVATQTEVHAVVCLGYPLLGGGRPDKRRDQVLRELRTPIQFIQGTRDRLCPLEDLEILRGELQAPSALHIVETGDHSLMMTKTYQKQTGMTQAAAEAMAVDQIFGFINRLPTPAEGARAATTH
ncbi:MAG: alpha/beta family hydrolase [Myxococcota bacterium]